MPYEISSCFFPLPIPVNVFNLSNPCNTSPPKQTPFSSLPISPYVLPNKIDSPNVHFVWPLKAEPRAKRISQTPNAVSPHSFPNAFS